MRSRVVVAAAILTAAWLAAYVPTIAGGFIKDDFGWIYHSRLTGWSSLYSTFASAHVFYRPLVQLSFGVTEFVFGTNPVPYALTNLALGLACAAAIYHLSRRLGLAPWAAVVATAVWAFNFHGINMSLLWLSGRTSLLLTLFALLTVIAARRGWLFLMFLGALLALGSKEEAVVLPLICAVWAGEPWTRGRWLDHARRLMTGARRTWPTLVALVVYLIARATSGAYTAASAPPYYRFTFEPSAIIENILQYADRSMTVFAIAIAAWALAVWAPPSPRALDRDLVIKGLVWFAAGFALTLWLPVRSSLYALFPSVGMALIAAAIIDAMRDASLTPRMNRATWGALLLPFLLLPIYWSRNERWVELADLTTRTASAIEREAATIPAGSIIELRDDRSTRANFGSAFAGLAEEASRVLFGGRYRLWIVPSADQASAARRTPPAPVGASFELRGGQIIRVR